MLLRTNRDRVICVTRRCRSSQNAQSGIEWFSRGSTHNRLQFQADSLFVIRYELLTEKSTNDGWWWGDRLLVDVSLTFIDFTESWIITVTHCIGKHTSQPLHSLSHLAFLVLINYSQPHSADRNTITEHTGQMSSSSCLLVMDRWGQIRRVRVRTFVSGSCRALPARWENYTVNASFCPAPQ